MSAILRHAGVHPRGQQMKRQKSGLKHNPHTRTKPNFNRANHILKYDNQ